jgi:hypothetical protein
VEGLRGRTDGMRDRTISCALSDGLAWRTGIPSRVDAASKGVSAADRPRSGRN